MSLVIKQLSYQIEKKQLLQSLAFELETGHCLGIIGSNGAGKSTLLRLISGYLKPSQGRIYWRDQDLSYLQAQIRARQIAFVNPREERPAFAMSVSEYLKLGRAPWQDWLGSWLASDQQALERALAETAIESLYSKSLNALSSGEWQMVQFTRALVQEPELLLLDEPTSHLDLAAQLQTMRTLQRLCERGLTVICVLHDLNLAAQYMQKLLLLHQGNKIAFGDVSTVMQISYLEQVYQIQAQIYTHPDTQRPYILPAY